MRLTQRLLDGQAVMDCQSCELRENACTALSCRNRLKDRLAEYEDSISKSDIVAVVRCRDCEHARQSANAFDGETPMCECAYVRLPNHWHEYCSWGKRRKETT